MPDFHRIRSALYVPGDHEGAMAKAPSLNADMLIFDVEDGVADAQKIIARQAIQSSLNSMQTGSLCLVRVNHRTTSFHTDDVHMVAESAADGIMLSKVANTDDIDHAVKQLALYDRADMPVWCNIETPQGVLNAHDIAAHPHVVGIVAGTNDLANDLQIIRTPDRAGLMHSLQHLLLCAHAHQKHILDGTFVQLNDDEGLKAEAQQGRMLGFEGKTLIHPKQIDVANHIYSPSDEDIAHAKAVIETYEQAMQDNKAVAVLEGSMIEALHYRKAKKTVSQASH